MAKCVRCGKRGLFLKLDYNRHCPACALSYKQDREAYIANQIRLKNENALHRYHSIPQHQFFYVDEHRKRQRGFPAIKTINITPKRDFSRFVVFDTETTGITPSRDRIVELGAVRFVEGLPVERFCTLVNPECPIPPEASDVSGIYDSDVFHAPTISQVLTPFEAFIGTDLLIAHNLEFDLKMLFYSGSMLFDSKRNYLDTLAQARRLLKNPKSKYDSEGDYWYKDYDSDYDVENYKLETLCDYYDIWQVSSHRADFDALATGDLFLALVSEVQG